MVINAWVEGGKAARGLPSGSLLFSAGVPVCQQQQKERKQRNSFAVKSELQASPSGPSLATRDSPQATTSGRDVTSAAAITAVPVPDTSESLSSGNGKLPKKADLYILRTDGLSCSRETVRATGCLAFAHPSTQQHLLAWKTKPQCVLVLKKLGDELFQELLQIVNYLGKVEGMRIIVEPQEFEALAGYQEREYVSTYGEADAHRLHRYVDFITCLGGDGVVLHASSLFQRAMPPLIAFNLGSLGFLTNHFYQNYIRDLKGVIYGSEDISQCTGDLDDGLAGVHITLRMRLHCQIIRAGQDHPMAGDVYEVLNEVVVDRGSNPYLTKIECWESNRLITKVQADGVLLATPTGSTAYSVAAGGSMVHPNVPAILFTPVCPHSLSFRPVILPDYAELDLKIPGDARCPAWVCFDGKQRQELARGDVVRVQMSTNPVPTISKTDQTDDWFGSLERCFAWNDRQEQKPW